MDKQVDFKNFTKLDLDNLISVAFPFHVALLGEAIIGYFMQEYLKSISVKIEKHQVFQSSIYFEHAHLTIYKLLLDQSGKSSLNIQKLISILIDLEYNPDKSDDLQELRKEIQANVIKKYEGVLNHVRTFRNKLHAHIIVMPIEEKPKLSNDSNIYYKDLMPLINATIVYYIKLMTILGFNHDLNEYIDLDKTIKNRLEILLGRYKNA
jgi:hypothetical protein